jgi:hypothetical protein
MLRLTIYALTGLVVGCVAGLIFSAFLNASDIGLIKIGATLGLLCGAALAVILNQQGWLNGPFVKNSQVYPLSTSIDRDLLLLPKGVRSRVIEWIVSKLR